MEERMPLFRMPYQQNKTSDQVILAHHHRSMIQKQLSLEIKEMESIFLVCHYLIVD